MAPLFTFLLSLVLFLAFAQANKLHDILGVSPDASFAQIRKAYLKLALLYHPDKSGQGDNTESSEKFKQIAQAYEILTDPEKLKIFIKEEEMANNWDFLPNMDMEGILKGYEEERKRMMQNIMLIPKAGISICDFLNQELKSFRYKLKPEAGSSKYEMDTTVNIQLSHALLGPLLQSPNYTMVITFPGMGHRFSADDNKDPGDLHVQLSLSFPAYISRKVELKSNDIVFESSSKEEFCNLKLKPQTFFNNVFNHAFSKVFGSRKSLKHCSIIDPLSKMVTLGNCGVQFVDESKNQLNYGNIILKMVQ